MFNPLKAAQGAGDVAKMVNEARKLQSTLKSIIVHEQKGRFEIELSADMKVRSIRMNGEEMNDLKDCINDANEKAQKKAAEEMQKSGLGGLFGAK